MSESVIFTITDPNDSKLLVRDLNPDAAQHFLTVNIEEGDALAEVDLGRAASFDLHSHLGAWLGKDSDELADTQRIEELESALATEQKELRRAQSTIIDLTEQVEEMSVSPLNISQQQRAKALMLARDVVEETSSSNIFSKSGSKASLAGVISTAHYICSGERDYVVGEGEFIERQHNGGHRSDVAEIGPGGPAPHSELGQP